MRSYTKFLRVRWAAGLLTSNLATAIAVAASLAIAAAAGFVAMGAMARAAQGPGFADAAGESGDAGVRARLGHHRDFRILGLWWASALRWWLIRGLVRGMARLRCMRRRSWREVLSFI